jgi:hypothetical protein
LPFGCLPTDILIFFNDTFSTVIVFFRAKLVRHTKEKATHLSTAQVSSSAATWIRRPPSFLCLGEEKVLTVLICVVLLF